MLEQHRIRSVGSRALKILFFCALFLFFLAPLLRLLLMSFGEDGGYGLSHYARLLSESRTRIAVRNTLIIGIGATAFSTFFGSAFAFLVAYTDLRRRHLAEVLILLPFIIPSYIITLSWTGLFSENGAINRWLDSAGLVPVNLFSIEGIVFVHGMCTIPIVYMIVKAMLRRIPVDLEHASMAAGHGRKSTLLRINLALAAPAVASGAVLSFLATIDNFSIPAFLGISAGIPVLSTSIYEKAIGFGPSSFSDAAVLSVLLSILAIGGTLLEGFFVKRSPGLESVAEDASARIELPPKVRAAVEWTLLGGLFSFNIVPLVFMVLSALQRRWGLGYGADNLTLDNFRDLLSNPGVLRALRTSLFLATTTCAVCIVVGTTAAYLKIRRNNGAVKILEKSASLAYAIPGIVLALAMIFHWVEPIPGVRPGIYGTVTILAVAYVTRYLILQIKGSINAMLTVEPALEEAAVAGGSGPFAVWRKILIPLLARPVLASAFLVFIPAMTELTLSSILSAAGTRTIGLVVFNFQQAGDYSLAAAMSAVVVLLVLGGYAMLHLYKKLFERHKEEKNDRIETGEYIALVRPDAGAR